MIKISIWQLLAVSTLGCVALAVISQADVKITLTTALFSTLLFTSISAWFAFMGDRMMRQFGIGAVIPLSFLCVTLSFTFSNSLGSESQYMPLTDDALLNDKIMYVKGLVATCWIAAMAGGLSAVVLSALNSNRTKEL